MARPFLTLNQVATLTGGQGQTQAVRQREKLRPDVYRPNELPVKTQPQPTRQGPYRPDEQPVKPLPQVPTRPGPAVENPVKDLERPRRRRGPTGLTRIFGGK